MTRDDAWLRRLAEVYFFPSTFRWTTMTRDTRTRTAEARSSTKSLGCPLTSLKTAGVQIACELRLSEDQLGLLGAGVLEDLMDSHGADFLDRVEAAAKESAAMQKVVDAVWTMSMDSYVARAFKTLQSHEGKRRPSSPHPLQTLAS